MACFIVPAVEAVVTTVAEKVLKKKESAANTAVSFPVSEKLHQLNTMLWGGSALLAFEHIWHGEVVPWFPFLTNAIDSADRAEMLHEMSTSGVAMALLVTLVWAAITGVSFAMEKKEQPESSESEVTP